MLLASGDSHAVALLVSKGTSLPTPRGAAAAAVARNRLNRKFVISHVHERPTASGLQTQLRSGDFQVG